MLESRRGNALVSTWYIMWKVAKRTRQRRSQYDVCCALIERMSSATLLLLVQNILQATSFAKIWKHHRNQTLCATVPSPACSLPLCPDLPLRRCFGSSNHNPSFTNYWPQDPTRLFGVPAAILIPNLAHAHGQHASSPDGGGGPIVYRGWKIVPEGWQMKFSDEA